MRRISGSFWTLELDERLRRLEAEGLSAAIRYNNRENRDIFGTAIAGC
jgi:hypothetical protein